MYDLSNIAFMTAFGYWHGAKPTAAQLVEQANIESWIVSILQLGAFVGALSGKKQNFRLVLRTTHNF